MATFKTWKGIARNSNFTLTADGPKRANVTAIMTDPEGPTIEYSDEQIRAGQAILLPTAGLWLCVVHVTSVKAPPTTIVLTATVKDRPPDVKNVTVSGTGPTSDAVVYSITVV